MAGSVNKVILVGNLGKDPEVRSMQNGDEVCQLSIATSETWRDKNSGERKERTEWHRVVIFNENLVKVAKQYLKKGAKVYLEGSLQTRKWTDQSGAEKYTTLSRRTDHAGWPGRRRRHGRRWRWWQLWRRGRLRRWRRHGWWWWWWLRRWSRGWRWRRPAGSPGAARRPG